jgi:cell surface protein SprA
MLLLELHQHLKKISYGRIVIETDQTVKVLLYDINVVGNKWEDFYIRDLNGQIVPDNIINTYNISYLSGIVNNQRNSAHYTSPPGTYYIEDRRESSESALSMEIQNLQPGQQVLLRQRLFEPYSLLSYNKIKFWVYPELSSTHDLNPDSLDIIFRIGADSLNFYQVRERIHTIDYIPKMNRNYWTQFTYSLQEFTKLKELFPDDSSGEYIEGNKVYTFKGTPTLTNVRDIYLGVYIPDDLNLPKPYNGTIYFNDMRVSEPYEEIGVAKRLSLNSVFADLITLDIDYEDKSENFNTVIQRGRINTFTSSRTLNILNKFFLNKLFPNSWGLDIPLSLSRNYNLGIPRFLANSDLLYDNIIDPAEKDRQRTESLVYAADFGFSQRTAPKSPLLLYTINRTSLSGRIEKSYRYTPTTVDTTFNWRGTLNYNLSIPSDKVSFTLFRNYRLGWFPSTFNNSFTLNNSEPQSYNWEKREGVYGWYPRTQTVPTKTFTSNTNISWGLTSDISLSARLNTERDLKQKIYWKDINIGKMTQYVQDLGLNYNPNYLRDYINLTASAEARYSDSQRKYFQNTDEGQITMYQSDGNSNRTIRTNLTLLNSNVLSSWAAKLSAAHLGKEDKKKQEETKDLENELKYPSDEDIKKKEEERRKEEEWKKQQEESGKYEEGDKDYGKGFIEETDSG